MSHFPLPDPETTLRRQEAMDAARRRMQEKYDAQAARHAEMMAQVGSSGFGLTASVKT